MYKVNINAAYYESNLKMNKQPNKTRFFLTQQQKQFIEMNLPNGYKLNLVGDVDQKRNRTPKRTDAEFETQFFKKSPRRDTATSDKKTDKKQDRKSKESQQGTNRQEVVIKIQPIEEDVKIISKKEALESKKAEKAEKIQKQAQLGKKLQPVQEVKSNESKSKIQFEAVKNQQQYQSQKNRQSAKSNTNQQVEKVAENNACILEQAPKLRADQPANQVLLGTQIKNNQFNGFEHKQFCLRFVGKIKAHKASWPFRQPVDPINQGVPNYLQVVHEPMDLKTIEKKINGNRYEHIAEFHGDINKIFLNSYKFNPKETNYYALTIELESYYHQLLKQIQINPNALENDRPSKNVRTKTQNNQQDFAQETVNKKNRLIQPVVIKPVENPVVNPSQMVAQVKQKVVQTFPKQSKVASKPKPKSTEIDRKELFKRVQRLSSKALERILLATFGELEDERTTFNLDFQKLPEQSILKIDTIVKTQLHRFPEAKNTLPGLQKRMLLF